MDQEEFDEFEQATYSHAPNKQAQPSPSDPNTTFAVLESHQLDMSGNMDTLGLGSTTLRASVGAESLEGHSSPKEQSIWPDLGKVGSAHEVSASPFIIDFTKNYSLNEQITTPITQDFFGLNSTQASNSQNPLLLPHDNIIIHQNDNNPGISTHNDELLMGFSAQNVSFDALSFNQANLPSQATQPKVELFPNINAFDIHTNLYTAPPLKTNHEFDIFAPMTENTTINSQIAPNIQIKQQKDTSEIGIFQNGQHILQFDHLEAQTIPTVSQPLSLKQVKVEATQGNFMDFNTPVSTFPFITESAKIVTPQPAKQEAVDNIRKQSEEFQFHQAKPIQITEVEPRKQSQEFVFEATQHQPITEPIFEQHSPVEIITNHRAQLQQEDSQPVITTDINPIQQVQQNLEAIQQQQQEPIKQQQQVEDDEDEFGDFEETTTVQNQPQNQAEIVPPPVLQQDNTVKINEQYLNSHEAEYYRGKQKELQQLVDSLPDYSFLFAKTFLP